MPLPDQTLDVFAGGPANYARYLDDVAAAAREQNIPYIATFGIDIVPDNGWAGDTHHMNVTGALAFSAWLGERVSSKEFAR
jgi:hypothetical protein